jgi:NitT/TauT family transport system substrate-binding protein
MTSRGVENGASDGRKRRASATLANAITRRRALQSGAALLATPSLAALLSACGNGDSGGSDGGPVEITVTQWPDFMYGVPWAVAIAEGYFDDEGIDLKSVIGSTGGGTTVRNVVTGGLPLGAVAAPAAINAFNSGSPLKIVAGSIQNTQELSFITQPDSPIETVDDFAGKTLGYTQPGSVTQAVIYLTLQGAGIDPAEVTTLATGGISEGLTALQEGAIDVAPLFLPLPADDWKVLFETTKYVPDFNSVVLIAGGEPIDQDPDLIEKLIEVYRRGAETTASDTDKAVAAWTSQGEVSKEDATRALETIDSARFYGVELTAAGLNAVVESMRGTGLLSEEDQVAWEEVLDQQFLSEDEAADVNALKP